MVSTAAAQIAMQLSSEGIKLGDIKKRAKEIKVDHELALELWSTGAFYPRMLAVLIFDKKQMTQSALDSLAADMLEHEEKERSQLADWLLANQLMKDRKAVSLIQTWEKNPSSILRRLFWYHQARLRWTGKAPPDNTGDLVDALERDMATAPSEVQWAMNFCAGQIGIHEPEYRARCVELGEKLGLYKDDPVAKNCTPSYLPEFIRIEAAKLSGPVTSG